MKPTGSLRVLLYVFVVSSLAGCGKDRVNAAEEAPSPANVIRESDLNLVNVDHPDRFPLATAAEHRAAAELAVTGVVNPDISRNVLVISLASGPSR